MTLQDLTAVTNALAQNFRDDVIRTANRMSVALRTLPIAAGEGKNVAWDVETTGMLAETFSDGDDASNFGSDAVQPATISWQGYRSNFHLGDLAMAASRTSRTPAGLMQLLGRNLVNSTRKLASAINVDVFSSTSGLFGLDYALDDANTYAGINRTTSGNANFRAKVIDPGTSTQPSLDQIRDDIAVQVYTNCGEKPDLALCSPGVYRQIGSKFQEFRRYDQSVELNGGRRLELDGSTGVIQFEGCTFVMDKDATANRIYYLNTRYVSLFYLPQTTELGAMPEGAHDVPLEDGFAPVPLGMRVKPLAVSGASRKFSNQVFVQLAVLRPNACAIRKNVATS